MEATTNVWALYDLVAPHVDEVTVVHPFHVKVIATSLVKTDKRGTLALAKLSAAKLAPGIWIPPIHELRPLITHRQHLIKQRTAAKNRLQGVIFRNNPYAQLSDCVFSKIYTWLIFSHARSKMLNSIYPNSVCVLIGIYKLRF